MGLVEMSTRCLINPEESRGQYYSTKSRYCNTDPWSLPVPVPPRFAQSDTQGGSTLDRRKKKEKEIPFALHFARGQPPIGAGPRPARMSPFAIPLPVYRSCLAR
jgi:hypothetical protein